MHAQLVSATSDPWTDGLKYRRRREVRGMIRLSIGIQFNFECPPVASSAPGPLKTFITGPLWLFYRISDLVGRCLSINQLSLSQYLSLHIMIKTHDSESRGQGEVGRTQRRTSELFTRSTALKFVRQWILNRKSVQ